MKNSGSPVFLIGFMACGKTTLCRGLQKLIPHDKAPAFFDLDLEIERRAGTDIPSLFREKGEEEFRRLEALTLRELAGVKGAVIACGGGTPCYGSNMEFMNSAGTTILLEASVEKTVRRILDAPAGSRPLVARFTSPEELASFVTLRLKERMPFYSLASHRFSTDRMDTAEEVDITVRAFINQFRPLLHEHTHTPGTGNPQ